ncbi:MAG: hypothetical protein ACOYL8_02585 [Patescibacteria group bacterium]
MLNIFFGLLLLFFPFLLVSLFKDRQKGFLSIFIFVLVFQIIISISTQFFHVFTYQTILIINSIAALAVLLCLIINFKKINYKVSINWFLILAFCIIFFELYSVHYLYSGSISTVNGYKDVKNQTFKYPYFSDEWVGVSLTNYSINNNSLPIVNPLIKNSEYTSFPNIFLIFFSLLASLFMLVNISPLIGYSAFALITGLFICYLAYLFLIENKVGSFSAILASLGIPYIVNGQNLPGIWYLLPYIWGFVLFLICLIALSKKLRLLAWVSGTLSLLIYPPLLIFIIPTIIVEFLFDKETENKTKIKLLLVGSLLVLFVAVSIIGFQVRNFSNLFQLISSYILYPALDNGIPSFAIWNVIPLIFLPFIIFGLALIIKKNKLFLLAPISIGLILWAVYSQSLYFFILNYERTVIISSILLVCLMAFSFDWLGEKLKKEFSIFLRKDVVIFSKLVIILIFFIFAFRYTDNSDWAKMTLTIEQQGFKQSIQPLAPATVFLTEKEYKFFQKIKKANFISEPWKGLAIGAATGNYPLESKPSIIRSNFLSYNFFVGLGCIEKKNIAIEYKVRYVYSPFFDCQNFLKLKTGEAGYNLYKLVE